TLYIRRLHGSGWIGVVRSGSMPAWFTDSRLSGVQVASACSGPDQAPKGGLPGRMNIAPAGFQNMLAAGLLQLPIRVCRIRFLPFDKQMDSCVTDPRTDYPNHGVSDAIHVARKGERTNRGR